MKNKLSFKDFQEVLENGKVINPALARDTSSYHRSILQGKFAYAGNTRSRYIWGNQLLYASHCNANRNNIYQAGNLKGTVFFILKTISKSMF